MTETMTLLPCPFCGGEAEIVRAMDKDGRFAAVGCPACGAGSRQHYFVGDDAVPHVVSAWNRRAHLAQQAQVVDDHVSTQPDVHQDARPAGFYLASFAHVQIVHYPR